MVATVVAEEQRGRSAENGDNVQRVFVLEVETGGDRAEDEAGSGLLEVDSGESAEGE